jgi:hypothetical protein
MAWAPEARKYTTTEVAEPTVTEQPPIWDGHEPASPGRPPGGRVVISAIVALVVLASAGIGGWAAFADHDPKKTAAPAPATPAPAPAPAPATPEPTPEPDLTENETAPEPAEPGLATNIAAEALVEAPPPTADSQDGQGITVSYGAANLVDDDPETCWRMLGDGSGRTIELTLNSEATIASVGLINGYAKIDPDDQTDRYLQERRILRVAWRFGDGTTLRQTLLDDTKSVQTIELDEPITTDSVSLTIESTTSPGKADYDKTAISEIQILGR